MKLYKDKRAILPAGKQRLFLESLAGRLSIAEIARICRCSERTIRDWRREKFPIQMVALHALCKEGQLQLPRDFAVRDRYAHLKIASKKGVRSVFAKYGRIPVDEKRRKMGWKKWWETEGKFRQNPLLQAWPIRKPEKSVDLAEFIGVAMGDGGMSKYQMVITLHHKDDLAYSKFVTRLMERLFGIKPRVYHDPKNSINDIVISRKNLVGFLNELGLPIGDKVRQEFDIPNWIKADKILAIACIRGLIDTDGSVFTHSYRSKGKLYSYKKLSFTSRSAPLRLSVAKVLAENGMNPRLSGFDVRIDSIADVKRYFSIVGSSNPKHLKRYSQ